MKLRQNRAQAAVRSAPPKQRLASIWSLARRDEVTVWIHYRVQDAPKCRIFQLQWVEEVEP